MIFFNTIWLISLICLVVSFFALILLAKFFYKPIDNIKSIFNRVFPYELINNSGNGINAYRTIMFVYAGFCFSPIFVLSQDVGLYSNFKVFGIVITCLFGLGGILVTFLHFFNPNNVKVHSYLLTGFIATTILCGLLSFSFAFTLSKVNIENSISYIGKIIFGVLAIIPVLIIIFYCSTVKIGQWLKLEKNNEVISRPKVFPLAKLEWIGIFSLFYEEIMFFLILLRL